MTKRTNKQRHALGPNLGSVVKKEKTVDDIGPLAVYREERWQRLKAKGYEFDANKNRAVYCGTIAVPEAGDPGHVK